MTPEEKDKLAKLETEVKRLTDLLVSRNSSAEFDNFIRDIVFFDADVTSGRTDTKNIVDSHGDSASFTVPKTPNKYLKTYYRGQVIEIGVFVPPIT